jgi:hypothetical protein
MFWDSIAPIVTTSLSEDIDKQYSRIFSTTLQYFVRCENVI